MEVEGRSAAGTCLVGDTLDVQAQLAPDGAGTSAEHHVSGSPFTNGMPDFTSSDKVVEATSTHLCMDESTDILNQIATQIAIVHDRPTMVTASTWASTIGLLMVTTSALGGLGLVLAAARARAWRARAAVRVQAAARGYLLRRAARFFYCAAWNIQRKWRARARCIMARAVAWDLVHSAAEEIQLRWRCHYQAAQRRHANAAQLIQAAVRGCLVRAEMRCARIAVGGKSLASLLIMRVVHGPIIDFIYWDRATGEPVQWDELAKRYGRKAKSTSARKKRDKKKAVAAQATCPGSVIPHNDQYYLVPEKAHPYDAVLRDCFGKLKAERVFNLVRGLGWQWDMRDEFSCLDGDADGDADDDWEWDRSPAWGTQA